MKKETMIACQNKDIMSKVLAEEFKGKSFEVYGVNLPKIVDSRPTELAAVEANELRMDRLFLLEDGSYMIVDYESDYDEEKKTKYMGYIARLVKALYNELKYYPKLRVLIIYTADVTRKQTKPDLDLGAFKMHLEEAFLSKIDGDEVFERVIDEADKKKKLDDRDLMQLIITPLTYKRKEDKQKAIERVIILLDNIEDERQRVFVLKGLLVFCDKVILKPFAKKIRSMLMKTKVEQIIEQEKQEAIAAKVAEATKNVTESVTTTVTKSVSENIARNFLKSGFHGCCPPVMTIDQHISAGMNLTNHQGLLNCRISVLNVLPELIYIIGYYPKARSNLRKAEFILGIWMDLVTGKFCDQKPFKNTGCYRNIQSLLTLYLVV